MTLRTKGEQKAYLDGYERCANCIKKYLTDEDKQKLECLLAAVRTAVDIEDETAIKALEEQPSEDEEVIKVSKGVVKARQGRFVIYDVEWLKKNFYATEEKIYGQPKETCEDCISRKAELDGLVSIAKAKAKSDAQKALMGRVMFFTEQLPPVTPKYTEEEIDRAQAVEQAYIDKMVELRVEELKRPKAQWIPIKTRPMTEEEKEEIIEFCKMKAEFEPENEDIYEAIIKVLEQEPCEDCISRADVLDLAKKGVLISNSNYQSVCKAINELSSVTPKYTDEEIDRAQAVEEAYVKKMVELTVEELKRPKGHNCNEDYADCDQFVCSECGIELQDWHRVERDLDDGDVSYHEYTFRFCPNCGARMAESED